MAKIATLALIGGCAAATAAMAASVYPTPKNPDWIDLKAAVFRASPGIDTQAIAATQPEPGPGFSSPPSTGTRLDLAGSLGTETYIPGEGTARWRVRTVAIPRPAQHAVDTVRISLAEITRTPADLPGITPSGTDTAAYQATYTRGWPGLLAFDAGPMKVDVTPHAGFGVSNSGGQAEAGALVKLRRRLTGWMTPSGASDANPHEGQVYLFAAASGRAVGLNFNRPQSGGWPQLGLSTENASAIIRDVQAGIAWRKGSVRASLAWMRRKVQGVQTFVGWRGQDDSTVAVTVSIRPDQ